MEGFIGACFVTIYFGYVVRICNHGYRLNINQMYEVVLFLSFEIPVLVQERHRGTSDLRTILIRISSLTH